MALYKMEGHFEIFFAPKKKVSYFNKKNTGYFHLEIFKALKNV
jgi:hypothetical protein